MMRAFFIVTCVLSLIYIFATFGIAEAVRDARYSSWSEMSYDAYANQDYYDYDSYSSYNDYSYYEEEANKYTWIGGALSVFYMVVSVVVFLLALMKIKTQTMKVMSIIGLSIAGLFLLWAVLPMVSPDSISFDEIAPAFALAAIALLSFNIVGVVHAFKTST